MRNPLLLLVAITGTAAALILAGCGGGHDTAHRGEPREIVDVAVAKVEAGAVEDRVTYAGTIEPADKALIATKIMGHVEAIHVREGDRVQKGNLLATLQSGEIRAQLAQADAAIEEARVHFENAQKDLDRFKSLYEQKSATRKELDNVQAVHASAQARLRSAQESRRAVEELTQHVRLTAPFDGVITKRLVDVGDLAVPGKPVLILENIDRLEITAKVPEADIQYIEVGTPVSVSIPAHVTPASAQNLETLGDEGGFEAWVNQVVPSADPSSHQFNIKIFVENPDDALKPGMFARVSVSRGGGQTLRVPRSAIMERGQLEGVFVVDAESVAHLRWIRLGRDRGDEVEVVAGMDEGETVVVSGMEQLLDGQKVRVTQ
jgi:RND family efflux transporter MFP subunit